MERIYHDEVYSPVNEEANEFLLNLCELAKNAYECFDEDNYKNFILDLYNNIREKFNLPNKVLVIAKSEDGTEAHIVLFPKEANGNYYKVDFDEELKLLYISIE